MDENKNEESWIYIVGGGSGSGLILHIAIGVIVYWHCKKPSPKMIDLLPITYTAPETTNLGSPNVDTRRAGQYSALGQEPLEVQEPVAGQKIVINNDVQLAYASALLDYLEDLGADVQAHWRRLRARHYSALPVDV